MLGNTHSHLNNSKSLKNKRGRLFAQRYRPPPERISKRVIELKLLLIFPIRDMPQPPSIFSSPPSGEKRRTTPVKLARNLGNMQFRRRTFWAGWGGIIITVSIGVLVVGLLVGWVLLWVSRPEGPSITLLTLGCIAFTAVLAILATLQNRLSTYWKLQQAEALFLTGISHNLRTPVAAIRVAAQAMDTSGGDPEQRERLRQAIIHETRRLSLRVDNVLESSRMEVEKQAFSQEVVDLNELVSSVGEAARGIAEVLDGQIRFQFDPDLKVHGDARALRLMLDNVMDNAIKFADPKPDIMVIIEAKHGFALTRIIDSGIGFSEHQKSEFFRRFGRGDTGRPGLGLGLALARLVARGHGGDVHLHSAGIGKGAAAEIWLPLINGQNDG